MTSPPGPGTNLTDIAAGGLPKPGDQIGPYEVVRQIASGGMATVLAVRDQRDGTEVAMKLLLPMQQTDEARSRFRREFRALSRLTHPNVLRVHESGLLVDRPWFTMELLSGHDLRDEITRLDDLPNAERFLQAERILSQVARALAYIHDRGLVHRDVTPGNVMVTTEGHAKLMDFGVVKEDDAEHTAVGELIGTVAYMAPEQIEGEELDARTDLYSLGAVLYQMLTGRKVFQAHTLHGFMEKHLNEAPVPPRQHLSDVPTHLDAVCLRLLEKDPAKRFASASHLLHALGEREEDDIEDRWPPRTVGRIPVRARLHEGLDRIHKGQAGAAFLLTGPLGFGKTRMLRLTEAWSRHRDLVFAVGRCRADDRPFGAFTNIYRTLRPDEPDPLLEQVFNGTATGALERYPVIAAFRALVEACAPCVIALDDLENCDPASLELLAYLVRNTLEHQGSPVLFALTVDHPGTRVRKHLEQSNVVQTLHLGPLAPAEVEELVLSVIRPSHAATALAGRLHREADGSPAFIVDMISGLIEDGRIVSGDQGMELAVDASEITRSKLPMPASLRQALKDRLAPLSPEALAVGRTLAASRRRIPVEILVAAASVDEDGVMIALDELLDAKIVEERTEADVEIVGLAHGRYRDVLLAEVDPEELARSHRALGTALERLFRKNPGNILAELAWHFEQAGLSTKAYAYFVKTAQQHLDRSGYEECLAYLDRALAVEPTARVHLLLDEADRQLAQIHLARAQARMNLGQPQQALQSTRTAHALAKQAGDNRLRSQAMFELGLQLRQTGHNEQAEPYLTRAIQRAEAAGDQTLLPGPLYELAGVHWAKGDLQRAEQSWKQSLAIATRIGDQRAQGRGYNGLGILAICRGKSMEARKHMEESARIFNDLGMLGPLVIARVNLIEICLNSGTLRKALKLSEETLERCREAHQLQGMALAMGWRGIVKLTLNTLDDAMDDAIESLRLCRQIGSREDEVLALGLKVRVHFARGDDQGALNTVQELIPLMEHHDHEGIAGQVTAWHARALAGVRRRPAARAVLQNRRPDAEAWPHIQIRSQISLGRALCALGQHTEAREHFSKGLATAEAAGFRYFQLLAHNGLCEVETDETARARHDRVARAMARSLAANLPRRLSESFMARGWGLTASE